MAKLLIIHTCIFFLSFTAWAQQPDEKALKKKEKLEVKRWKKKLKETDPLEYEKIKLGLSELQENAALYKRQVENLKKDLAEASTLLPLKDKELGTVIEDCQSIDVVGFTSYGNGISFKVQIGAFDLIKEGDVPLRSNFSVGAERDGDLYKFTVGNFRDYGHARNFKMYLKKMGVSDAFIVGYKDNVRIHDIKEALKQAGQEKYIEEEMQKNK